ncbi:hypothetical protein [Pleomorphovibrio marinus]
MIVDNYSDQKDKSVKKRFEKKRKIQVHYMPTYSSWLNQG